MRRPGITRAILLSFTRDITRPLGYIGHRRADRVVAPMSLNLGRIIYPFKITCSGREETIATRSVFGR